MIKKGKTDIAKRIISIVLAALMVVTMLPEHISIAAADTINDEAYTITITNGSEEIKGASVTLYDEDHTKIGTAAADSSGSVTLPDDLNREDGAETLESGETYSCTVTARGYEIETVEFAYTAGGSTQVLLTALNPIQITGRVVAAVGDGPDEAEPAGSDYKDAVNAEQEDAEEGTEESVGLENATVTASLRSEEETVNNTDSVQTDGDGYFTLTVYEAGNYSISAEKSGYLISTANITDVSVEAGVNELAEDMELTEDTSEFVFSENHVTAAYQGDSPIDVNITLIQQGFTNDGTITYHSSDEEYVTVDHDGKITTRKPTENAAEPVTITAVRAKDSTYLEKTASYTITVTKGIQAELVWANSAEAAIPWNQAYTNPVSGGSGDGTLSYTVTVEPAIPEVRFMLDTQLCEGNSGNITYDEEEHTIQAVWKGIHETDSNMDVSYQVQDNAGCLTYRIEEGKVNFQINCAGTVTVTASYPGNANYEAVDQTYKVIIGKAAQYLSFEKEKFEYVAGKENVIDINDLLEDQGAGQGAFTYSFENKTTQDQANGIISDIDGTGKITFTGYAGEAVVKVTKAGDDCYYEAAAECTISVDFSSDEEKHYEILGTTSNSSGWYTGNVSIQAERGYQIVKESDYTGNTTKWSDKLENVVTEDAAETAITIYVKNTSDGTIQKVFNLNIRKDSTTPTAKIEIESISIWDKLLSIISFGNWGKETAEVSITDVKDATSGIASAEYYIDYSMDDLYQNLKGNTGNPSAAIYENLETLVEENGGWNAWEKGDGGYQNLVIEKDKEFVVYAKVTDAAGNSFYTSTNGVIFESVKPTVKLELVSESAGYSGYYNDTQGVKISVSVADDTDQDGHPVVSSGIQKIDYIIYKNSELFEKETTIFDYEEENPKKEDLITEWSGDGTEGHPYIVIPVKENELSTVRVEVAVTDQAGNQSVVSLPNEDNPLFVMDIRKPEISVEWEEDNRITETEEISYYNPSRTAIITVTEDSFSDSDAVEAVHIRKDGVELEADAVREMLELSNGENEVSNEHKINVTFAESGTYQLYMTGYRDMAGNEADKQTDSDNQYESEEFIVDTEPPTAAIDTSLPSRWDELLETITFGLWSKNKVEVTASAGDSISPVTIEYLITAGNEKLDLLDKDDKLNALKNGSDLKWIPVDTVFYSTENAAEAVTLFTSDRNEQFVVYLRATDYAGNETYVSSDGIITDNQAPDASLSVSEDTPEGSLPQAQCDFSGLDIYTGDVVVNVHVEEQNAEFASGIREIRYWITDDEAEENITQEGILYSVSYEKDSNTVLKTTSERTAWSGEETSEQTEVTEGSIPTYNQLCKKWDGTITVKTDAEKKYNNSCYVKVHIQVADLAGNSLTEEELKESVLALDIDRTAPVIHVSYDNNDVKHKEEEGDDFRGYFDQDRTAQITITERTAHFDGIAAAEGVLVSAVDSQGEPVDIDLVEMMGGGEKNQWITIPFEEDSNKDMHTAAITYSTDGNYTFGIDYTDLAGWKSGWKDAWEGEEAIPPVDTEGETPYLFTIDHNAPVATINTDLGSFWTALLEKITFGLWTRNTVQVTALAGDETSPVTLSFYVTNGMTDLDRIVDLDEKTKLLNQLDEKDWISLDYVFIGREEDAEEIEVCKQSVNEQFVVYLRATDYAGNTYYVSSDGIITDQEKPDVKVEVSEKTDENSLPISKEKCSVSNLDIYRGDVIVAITVTEPNQDIASGIGLIEYWVTSEGKETQRETLYSFDYQYDQDNDTRTLRITDTVNGNQEFSGDVPEYGQLRKKWEGSITVDSELNNSCDVIVHVLAKDNAGNVLENAKLPLDIDVSDPAISVSYDNNDVKRTVEEKNGSRGYFSTSRTAAVTITERTAHFNGEDADTGITVKAVDSQGKEVKLDFSKMLGSWNTQRGGTSNEDTHTAYIQYTVDANYTFEISYTDIAGRSNSEVDTGTSMTPYLFTVDQTRPEGEVKIGSYGIWETLIEKLTFGRWSNQSVTITGSSKDVTSPIASVVYYKTADVKAKTEKDLKGLKESDWQTFGTMKLDANEQFTVYLRITDYAGNARYISTNGMIVDDVSPVEESIQPQITISPKQPVNNLYNTDVPVNIQVTDPIAGGTYSGLKEVRYEVRNMGSLTQQGTLFAFTKEEPTQAELHQSWSGSITVNKEQNNSNEVEIWVYAADNAGNTSSDFTKIQIDVTDPSIQVAYNTNAGDTTFGEAYFKEVRTATVTITERNFDENSVSIQITNTDGTMPSISGWTTVGGTGNMDDTQHIATITYSGDGDYTFDISCNDKAGNQNTEVDYGGSLAPKKFTIDRTAPVIGVSYDNNSSENGNYYKEARTATISIAEHNFETSRVVVTMTAEDDGKAIEVPGVSGWSGNGDINTATIRYDADGLYTLDVSYQDMAGNAAESIATETFYVDQTKPSVEITNIVDDSANAEEGDIGFVITATDTNFDVFIPVLTAVVREGDQFVRKTLEVGEFASIKNGKTLTVQNLDTDGIYYLSCTVVDKAGNAFDEVTLYDASGNAYRKQYSEEVPLVSFSVNRDGSAFELGEYTVALVDTYYVQKVTEDIVIFEVNADPLNTHNITLNGRTLREGTDFTVAQSGGEGKWYRYTYAVSGELFEEEGEYNIVVSSLDKAESSAFSDIKSAAVHFVVDQTAPVVSVSGMESNGRYQVEKQTVTLIPTDDGGALQSILAQTVDQNGKKLEVLFSLMGRELEEALETGDGKLTFEIPEGLYQNIQIICTDQSVGEDGTVNTYNETFTNISVSSNAFMIFWANKTLRYGSLTGAGIVALALILLVFLKKRKKKGKLVQEAAQ